MDRPSSSRQSFASEIRSSRPPTRQSYNTASLGRPRERDTRPRSKSVSGTLKKQQKTEKNELPIAKRSSSLRGEPRNKLPNRSATVNEREQRRRELQYVQEQHENASIAERQTASPVETTPGKKSKRKKKEKKKGNVFMSTLRYLIDVILPTKKKPKHATEQTNDSSSFVRTKSLPANFKQKFSRQDQFRVSRSSEFPSVVETYPSQKGGSTVNAHLVKEFDRLSVSERIENSSSELDRMTPLQRGFPNYGNSCYWNAALQCVGAMEPLAVFYLSGQYKKNLELNKNIAYGTEMSHLFAKLIEAMWKNTDASEYVRRIRSVLERSRSMFTNNQQQDAHEFLLVLLHSLSLEVSFPKFNKQENSLEDSIFTRMIGGYIGESTKCTNCNTVSHSSGNYTQFLHLNFPSIKDMLLPYSFVSALGKYGRVHRRCTNVSSITGVHSLRQMIGFETATNENKILIFQCNYTGFQHFVVTDFDVVRKRNIMDGDCLYATELDNLGLTPDGHEIVNCLFLHSVIGPSGRKRMTEPFKCALPVNATYQDLVRNLFNASRVVVPLGPRDNILDRIPHFRIFIHDDNAPTGHYIPNQINNRYLLEGIVTRHMDEYQHIASDMPRLIRLVVEWRNPPPSYFVPNNDSIIDHISHESAYAERQTLMTLFNRYFQPELITDRKCEHCSRQGGIKRCHFLEPPKIIAVMIKRFDNPQNGASHNQPCDRVCVKIDSDINIQLNKFDISSFVEYEGKDITNDDRSDYIYDCISILCHKGSLSQGHYIAYTRNPVTDVWRKYDDSLVHVVRECDVDVSDAYLVFMQQRSARLNTIQRYNKTKENGFSFFSKKRDSQNMLPNGPLVNIPDRKDMKRSNSFRRDDSTRHALKDRLPIPTIPVFRERSKTRDSSMSRQTPEPHANGSTMDRQGSRQREPKKETEL